MQTFEYKVVPAPAKGEKARGLKSTGERFAYALSMVMNDLAGDGWEYLRADTLPCEERTGLRGRSTTFQNVLVFRRASAAAAPVMPAAAIEPRGPTAQDRAATFLTARAPEGVTPRLSAADAASEGHAPKLGAAGSEGMAAE